MFPFRKPPTKLELAKKGVADIAKGASEIAHSLIDSFPAEQIEEKFDDLKKGAVLAAGAAGVAASSAAHHAGEIASSKFDELQTAAANLGDGIIGAAHGAGSATQNAASSAAARASAAAQSAAAVAAAKAGAATQNARETAQSARETLGETAQSAREALGERAKGVANFRERAAHDMEIGGKEARNAKEVAQKAAEREAVAVKARAAAHEAKKAAKVLEKEAEIAQYAADKTVAQAKDAALVAAAEIKRAHEEAEKRAALEEQARLEAAAKAEAAKARAEADEEEEAAHEQGVSAKVAEKAAKAEAKLETKARAAAEKAEFVAEKAEGKIEKAKREVVRDSGDGDGDFAEVKIADTGSKWGWVVFGLALGAVLALLFAPTSGRRSRAAIKDRLGKVGDGAVDAATATSDKIGDIANRVEGLVSQVDAKLAADSEIVEDDGTIADRVRSTLGHHNVAKTIERLNIDCAEGVVTLRGPMLDQATQDVLVTAVKTIPGVKDVVADFLTDEEPESPANSVI